MGRFRRRTLVLDCGDGRWSYGQRNENYLGFPRGVSARSLHALGSRQAARFGVRFEPAEVTSVALRDGVFTLATGRGERYARTVIWASGVQDQWPSFVGARRLVGKRLFWCIVCDGWRTRERPVLLIGNSRRDASTALQFLTYTPRVTFVIAPERAASIAPVRARLEAEGVRVLATQVTRVQVPARGRLRVCLADGERLRVDYVFSLLGSQPRVAALSGLALALSPLGYVRVDRHQGTPVPGLFAAGDVTEGHSHQVATAVHEGASAAQAANHSLYPARQRI
jgi:thioredoxin reductase (NADPH)